MSSASEKANLARIRDNQRRSRARRKEYLQELEARLRQCELQGIEASSEIQMAARRVADENKKLRTLLVQQGMGEDNIEAYLQSSPVDAMMGSSYTSSGAVQILEQLLQTRKACCTDGNNPTPKNTGGGSRESSGSVSTVSVWDPTYSQNTGGRRRSGSWQQQGGKAASSAQQFMTPGTSAASRTSSVVSQGQASHRSASHHHQRLSSAQMPRTISPNSSHSHQNHQSMFDFDSQLSLSPYSQHQSTAQKHLQPLDNPQRIYMPQSGGGNVNNCNFATDIITSMAGVTDPSAVRADLGCLPNGMECEVDNQLVFNVMDRYSGVGL